MNHRFSTLLVVLLGGVIIIAILASGFDIGDTAEYCGEGEYARVLNDTWSCVNITAGTNITHYNNFTIYNGTVFLRENVTDYLGGENLSDYDNKTVMLDNYYTKYR